MSHPIEIQYVCDAEGKQVAALVPIELWREIASERETVFLLKSPAMKKRLMEAKERTEGVGFDEARKNLGI